MDAVLEKEERELDTKLGRVAAAGAEGKQPWER